MKRRLDVPFLAAVVAIVGLVPATASAADLEVGSGQTYATIQAGIDAAGPGDTVRVHAGSYTEALSLSQSGGEGMPIVVTAAGDGDVTLAGSVEIDGDFWVLSDFAIQAPADVRAISIDGSHNLLENLEMSGGTRNAVDGGGTGNEVRGCRIHDFDAGDSDAHCIVLNPGAEDWVIQGNELYDCSGDGVQLYGPSGAVSRDIRNTTISSNVIRWTGGIGRMENAIDVKNADGLLIENNEMSGFIENKTMVFQKGPIAIVARCNVMFGGFTGVEFRGEDGGTVEDVTFEHNLMHDFSDYAFKVDGVTGVRLVSNTFVDAASDGLRVEGAGVTGGVAQNNLWVRTGALDPGFTADHNGFFETGNVGIASGSDVQADPLLDAEYALGATSPMVDAGVDAGLPFAGAAPDIGFAEVGLDVCNPPSQGGGAEGGAGAGGGPAQGGGPPGAGGGPSGNGGDGGASAGDGASDDGGCDCTTPAAREKPVSWAMLLLCVLLIRVKRASTRRSRR